MSVEDGDVTSISEILFEPILVSFTDLIPVPSAVSLVFTVNTTSFLRFLFTNFFPENPATPSTSTISQVSGAIVSI